MGKILNLGPLDNIFVISEENVGSKFAFLLNIKEN